VLESEVRSDIVSAAEKVEIVVRPASQRLPRISCQLHCGDLELFRVGLQ
jgi:hypothetical protein